jgi:hypothetical protein
MRHVVTLVLVVGSISSDAVAAQARAGGSGAGQPAIRACSILTKDLVAPFAENKQILDIIPPTEEQMASSGVACDNGPVRLQLFPGSGRPKTPPKVEGLRPVSGAGEAAYFRSNRDRYAELMVYTAKHYFTLQVSVPAGKTAEAIRPDVLALANAIIAKLR